MNQDVYRKQIGNNIKEIRKTRGWTQQDLADRMGLKDKASISRIENGVEDMTTPRVQRVADALNVNINAIIGNPDAVDKITYNVDLLMNEPISESERFMVLAFRQADEDTQNMIKRLLAYSESMRNKE